MIENPMVTLCEEQEIKPVAFCKICDGSICEGDFYYSLEINSKEYEFCEECINNSKMEAEGYNLF